MKLHSDTLSTRDIYAALDNAKRRGLVAKDIDFEVLNQQGSRKRKVGFEIQLGTYDKTSGPTKSRRFKNTGTGGADSIWAATYNEWGWFIRELFKIDPNASFGPYDGVENFHVKTKNAYC